MTTPNKETEAEAKRVKEIFAAAVEGKDDFDDLLENRAWVKRFLRNGRGKKSSRINGPLMTAET